MLRRGIIGLLIFVFWVGCAGAAELTTAGDDIGAIEVKSIRITEIMASNQETLEDAFGRSSDWIELYNTTDKPISLKGVCLSDKKSEPDRYIFPDDAVIPAHEYVLVFASGAKKDIADEYHTSFKLSALGESLYLRKDSILVDSIFFDEQATDISLALDEDGEYKQTSTPTPGFANEITEP